MKYHDWTDQVSGFKRSWDGEENIRKQFTNLPKCQSVSYNYTQTVLLFDAMVFTLRRTVIFVIMTAFWIRMERQITSRFIIFSFFFLTTSVWHVICGAENKIYLLSRGNKSIPLQG